MLGGTETGRNNCPNKVYFQSKVVEYPFSKQGIISIADSRKKVAPLRIVLKNCRVAGSRLKMPTREHEISLVKMR